MITRATDAAQDGPAEVTRALRKSAGALAARVAEVAHLGDPRDSLATAQAAIVGGAREFKSASNGYVHRHPWRVIATATLAGLLAGVLLARR